MIEVLRFLYTKKLRKKRGRVLETLALDLEFERTSGVEVLRGFDGLGSARILGDGAKGLKMDITITRDRLFHALIPNSPTESSILSEPAGFYF